MFEIIVEIFRDSAEEKLALDMRAYMKNKFDFFGIKTPLRRQISKPILEDCKTLSKRETIELAKKLWKQPQRELHYLAQELLFQNLKKNLSVDDIDWMEFFVIHNSWWDTVDFIAPKLIGTYFKKFPEQRDAKIAKWISSGNIWLMRSAILFQLKYKDETDLDFLFRIILSCSQTKEFFINKVIGWVLRENAKRVPTIIYRFIADNKSHLSTLSINEGLKHKTS